MGIVPQTFINKPIWSRNHGARGVVKRVSDEYCFMCKTYHTCFVVKWDDGNVTKPCISGTMINKEGDLEII